MSAQSLVDTRLRRYEAPAAIASVQRELFAAHPRHYVINVWMPGLTKHHWSINNNNNLRHNHNHYGQLARLNFNGVRRLQMIWNKYMKIICIHRNRHRHTHRHTHTDTQLKQTLSTDLASGSSNVSRFSHRVAMMLSYLLGYLRKMSWKQKRVWGHVQLSSKVSVFSPYLLPHISFFRLFCNDTQYIPMQTLHNTCNMICMLWCQNIVWLSTLNLFTISCHNHWTITGLWVGFFG